MRCITPPLYLIFVLNVCIKWMESQYCHIVIYVYDSQYLHLHLVIIKEGQEFTKKNKSTIMLISKWIIYWNFINKQQLRTCFTNGWCNLQTSSSQIFTLSSLGFSKSLDGFVIQTTMLSISLFAYLQNIEHQLTN